jgi:hypothetical protein
MPDTVALPLVGHVVTTVKVNVRQGEPKRSAPLVRKLLAGTAVSVAGIVVGEAVEGNAHWYRMEEGTYIWAGACGALTAGSPPPAPPPGSAGGNVDPSLKGYGLEPAFAAKLSALLEACRSKGYNFKISQGLRTPQRQALYFCQWAKRSPAFIDGQAAELDDLGAPWTAGLLRGLRNTPRQKQWQTSALPGAGWHQWGEAADCYCYRNGILVENGSDPCYKAYADLAREIGLTAGFYFSKQDSGHVQLRSAGGADKIYAWPHIDEVMKERFGDKPGDL